MAEHSARVARALPRDLTRWGPLHDATEAFLGALPRPFRQRLPASRRAEEELMPLSVGRFGLCWPTTPEAVEADTMLAATEAQVTSGDRPLATCGHVPRPPGS